MRPIAGNAALRPDQNRSRCFSSFETRISVAPALGQHAPDFRHVGGDFLRPAIRLAQQHRGRIERIVGVNVLVDGARRGLIHHFETGRQYSRGDHRADRRAGLGDVVERGERHLRKLWLRRELDRDFGGDREQTLGAVDQRQKIVTGTVQRVAAQFDNVAGDEHGAHAKDVMHGEAVLEAMHAARVLGHVAADRAGDL